MDNILPRAGGGKPNWAEISGEHVIAVLIYGHDMCHKGPGMFSM